MKRTLLILVVVCSALSAHAADVQPAVANCASGPTAQSQRPTQEAADARLEVIAGEDYYHQKKMELAFPAFDRALRLDLCNGRAHYYLWRLDTLAGNIAEAHKHLQYAYQLSPDDVQVQRTWMVVQHAIQMESEPGAPR